MTVGICADDWQYKLDWASCYRSVHNDSDIYFGGRFWSASYFSDGSDGEAKYPAIWLASVLARLISKMTRLQKFVLYVPPGSHTNIFASELQKSHVLLPKVTTLVTVPCCYVLIALCPNITSISTSHWGKPSEFFGAAQTATKLAHLTIKRCRASYLGMNISPYVAWCQ